MKKVMLICLLILGATVYAQPPGNEKNDRPRKERKERMEEFTPQQIAELKTKRMTLDLDLSPTQQSKILSLHLKLANEREQKRDADKKEEKPSSNERYERLSKHLDAKIEMKKQLKSILTEAQFEKFEKSHSHRKKGHRQKMGRKKR